MLNKHRLMVPGPTPLPPGVTAAATLPMADERTPEFAEVFTRVIRRLQHVLGTGNDVLMLTSSMTGAFESAVQNLFSPGERVLVLDNGLFGRRWVDMCRAFGLEVTELGAPWGSEIEPAAVADALAADSGITAVLCVHCETSTGVVNDIRSCAAAARSARGPGDGVLVVVDAASGLGACELRTDEWGVDVVVGGGQKALMTPPGMSFVSVSERAWRRQAEARLPRFYFDWSAAALAGRAEIPRTAWTPAIGVLVQMDAALAHLLEEGVEAALERHVLLGRMARGGFLGMGLRLLTPDSSTGLPTRRCCASTATSCGRGRATRRPPRHSPGWSATSTPTSTTCPCAPATCASSTTAPACTAAGRSGPATTAPTAG